MIKPIVLSVFEDEAAKLKAELKGKEEVVVLRLEEISNRDKEREAKLVYKTDDIAHPGVAYFNNAGPVAIAGEIMLVEYIVADETRKISPFDDMPLLELIVKTGIAKRLIHCRTG